MRYVLSFMTTIGHPQSCMVEGTMEADLISLSTLDHPPELTIDQTVSLYPVASQHYMRELLEDQTLYGHIVSTKPLQVRIKQVHQENEVSFINLVQRKVPQSNQYMQRYNERIAHEILNHLVPTSDIVIITDVGGVLLSTAAPDAELTVTDQVYIKPDSNSFLAQHLRYTSFGLITGKYNHKSFQIEVNFRQTNNSENQYEVIPLQVAYGTKTSLETHTFSSALSTKQMIRVQTIKKMNYWFTALRTPQFLITLLSILVGMSLVQIEIMKSLSSLILIVLGTFCIQTGGNLLNDYFDHKSENDEINISAQLHSYKFIKMQLLHPILALSIGICFFGIGAAIGLYLNYISHGQVILMFGLLGGLTTYFYTGEPLKLAYRGIGEIVLAITFGPLIIIGTSYVLTNQLLSLQLIVEVTIPALLLISALFILNSIDDIEADRIVQKMTTAVKLGRSRSVLLAFGLMIISELITLITIVSAQIGSSPIILVMLVISASFGTYSTLIESSRKSVPSIGLFSLSYVFWALAIIFR